MFTILTNTRPRNFTNAFFGFRKLEQGLNKERSRINETNRHYYFDPSRKTFSFSQHTNHKKADQVDINSLYKDNEHFNDPDKTTWNLSAWATVIGSIFAYLWINKSAQAEEEMDDKITEALENHQVKLLTKENFKEICLHLRRDNPIFRSLEMQFALTESELKAFLNEIKDNSELGYITWHKNQVRHQTLLDIETRLIENNKNYRYYPSDYTHALLSKHAYVTSTNGSSVNLDPKMDQHLVNWKVVEVFDDTKRSGYYGAIYVNDKTHQVVLANRGTEEIIKGLFNRNGDWKTNFEEILGGRIIVGQQAKNLRATAAAIEIAKEKGYRLSFTGHSLGAWLAELSAYYCFAYFDYRNVKAVTFDSPGTAPMMKQLQPNIKSRDAVNLSDLDIVTYLSGPNPANSCNGHVGTVYRVETKMKMTEVVESKLPNIIKNNFGDKIKALLSIEGHFLSGILETFDPETGKPKACKKMLDWPRVEYLGTASFSSEGKKIAKEGIGKSGISGTTQMALNLAIDHLIDDGTVMTIVGFLKTYIKGGIDAEQYWAYFRHIDLEIESQNKGEQRTEFSFDNRFALYTLGKYREGKNTHLMDLRTGSVDKYLYKLFDFKKKLKDNEDLPFIVKVQLNELLKSFKIVPNGNDYILIPNQGYDVEGIKEKTKRLLDVIPSDIRAVWKNVVINTTKVYLNGEAAEAEKIKKLADNLVSLTSFYIGIRNKEKELKEKLYKEDVVVISGFGGMGKSTLATKYGKDRKQEDWQVRWIKGMQIDEEFFKLAQELKIKTNNLTPYEVKDLVYQKLEKIGREKPVLLIFDNVEDGKKMSQYLVNKPAQAKIIITSRDTALLKEIKSIQMEGFDKEQAITYVREVLGRTKNEAEKLVNVVGLSPFRLSKAVAYLGNNDLMSINEYVKYYEAVKKGHSQNKDVYPEVELLFGDIKKNAPISWQLLQYMTYLDAEGVPVEFIMKVMGLTKQELQIHVNELKKLSLMSGVVSEGDKMTLKLSHRIVQEETKKVLMDDDTTKIKAVLEKLMKELGTNFDDAFKKYDSLSTFKEEFEFITHGKTLVHEANMMGLLTKHNALLIYKIALYYLKIKADDKQAIHYWEELLNNQKLLNTVDSPQLFIADVYMNIGRAHINLGNENNIRKGIKYEENAIKVYQNIPEARENYAIALLWLGTGYRFLEGNKTNQQISVQYQKEALGVFRKIYSGNHPQIAESLFNLAATYSFFTEEADEDGMKKGLIYFEEALIMNYQLGDWQKIPDILCGIATSHAVLGDLDKALEYNKQAYSILSAELGSEHKKTKFFKDEIGQLQPNFFNRIKSQQTQTCLGGHKVGNECRYIITSRGETDENLIKLKQKIQVSILNRIVPIVDDERWCAKHGWSNEGIFGEMGIKGYLEKDYLRKQLGELGNNDKNIELAQMLCFEATSLAIMKSETKAYDVVKSFARHNPVLVKKIAVEHPEFFVDGSIVEACIQAMPGDKAFEAHLLKHVKYTGMEERKNSRLY